MVIGRILLGGARAFFVGKNRSETGIEKALDAAANGLQRLFGLTRQAAERPAFQLVVRGIYRLDLNETKQVILREL